MEPQASNPNIAPNSGSPASPETPKGPLGPEKVPEQPAEAPAAPEVDKPKEAADQNAGMHLPQVQTPAVSVPDEPKDDDQDDPHSTVVADAPAIADDVDVLEKEWVDKAKDIVDKNKDDPYQQNKKVSVLKADYMKKRYGKDIKLTND